MILKNNHQIKEIGTKTRRFCVQNFITLIKRVLENTFDMIRHIWKAYNIAQDSPKNLEHMLLLFSLLLKKDENSAIMLIDFLKLFQNSNFILCI